MQAGPFDRKQRRDDPVNWVTLPIKEKRFTAKGKVKMMRANIQGKLVWYCLDKDGNKSRREMQITDWVDHSPLPSKALDKAMDDLMKQVQEEDKKLRKKDPRVQQMIVGLRRTFLAE